MLIRGLNLIFVGAFHPKGRTHQRRFS